MATIYDGNSNCKECGRLVAPSSGLYGPLSSSIFCCRRCLKTYYDEQPGLWHEELNKQRLIELQREEQYLLSLEPKEEEYPLLEIPEKKAIPINYNKLIKFLLSLVLFIILIFFLRSCH